MYNQTIHLKPKIMKTKNNNSHYHNSSQKGFTLIELLVVIAIIGILAAIVLVSLNSAKNKGIDAAIKSDISSLRSQAALYYDTNTGYGETLTTCSGSMWSDTKIASILAHLNLQTSSVSCRSSADSWALSAPLKSNTSTYWCADSSGQSGQGSINATTGLCDVSTSGSSGDSGSTGDTGDTFSSGGLTWTSADAPSGYTGTWYEDVAYCSSLGAGWRLPTYQEIKTLSDASYQAYGSTVPSGFTANTYMTSTESPSNQDLVWGIGLWPTGTTIEITPKNWESGGGFVRCVN